MMPLKDNIERTDENNKKEKVSGALSTEEIVSLLNKSNKDFIKESEISSTITNLFKKVTPTILAEKNKDSEEQKNNKIDNKIESKSEEIIEEEVDTKNPEDEKKYTEAEAKKLANDYAKQYYNNGYKLGVKKNYRRIAERR